MAETGEVIPQVGMGKLDLHSPLNIPKNFKGLWTKNL